MPYIPPEVVEQARQIDLLTYLQSCEPQELVRISGNNYTTRTHDSLKISNGKWMWWSQRIGGYNALDYLVKVKGCSFRAAGRRYCQGLRLFTAESGKRVPEKEGCTMNCCCPCGADKKTAICAYLREHHTGKSRAIHSEDLQRLFCLDGRNIRRKISALRQAGHPICSDESGYYFADNQKEINNTVYRLNGMVTQVSNARTGLLVASVFPAEVNVKITVNLNGGENFDG